MPNGARPSITASYDTCLSRLSQHRAPDSLAIDTTALFILHYIALRPAEWNDFPYMVRNSQLASGAVQNNAIMQNYAIFIVVQKTTQLIIHVSRAEINTSAAKKRVA